MPSGEGLRKKAGRFSSSIAVDVPERVCESVASPVVEYRYVSFTGSVVGRVSDRARGEPISGCQSSMSGDVYGQGVEGWSQKHGGSGRWEVITGVAMIAHDRQATSRKERQTRCKRGLAVRLHEAKSQERVSCVERQATHMRLARHSPPCSSCFYFYKA